MNYVMFFHTAKNPLKPMFMIENGFALLSSLSAGLVMMSMMPVPDFICFLSVFFFEKASLKN